MGRLKFACDAAVDLSALTSGSLRYKSLLGFGDDSDSSACENDLMGEQMSARVLVLAVEKGEATQPCFMRTEGSMGAKSSSPRVGVFRGYDFLTLICGPIGRVSMFLNRNPKHPVRERCSLIQG